MKTFSNFLVAAAVITAVGCFVFYEKKQKQPDKKSDGFKNASGTQSDPFMMLEVDESNFPNFAGGDKVPIATSNYPFGENFKHNQHITIDSLPFRRKA